LKPSIDAFADALPAGFHLATGGAVEESAKSQGPIAAVVPVMLLVMAFLLMIQLQSAARVRGFGKLALVVSVGPLGFIGVVAAPLGFVALLGVLALHEDH
jgi:multidrug efflux pump